MKKTGLKITGSVAFSVLISSGMAWATADGPDYYEVRDVAADDVLNIRDEPSARAKIIGSIPPDGQCIRNLGCRGGLTFDEFTRLTEAEKKQRSKDNPRWCKIEYRGITGWVAARYLAEGNCQDQK